MDNTDTPRPIDREMIAAFADGELAPAEAARVLAHLADHPADQAFVDRILAERALLAQAFGPIAAEPVPERTRAAIEAPATAKVLAFPSRRVAAVATAALAAAAAAFFVVGTPGPRPDPVRLAAGPVPDGGPLATALDRLASGAEETIAPGAALLVQASFADADGRICREVQLFRTGVAGFEHAVACAAGDGWSVEVAVAERAAPDDADAFAPAGGAGSRAVDAMLDAIGAGPALDPEAEAAARARGWRP
jgi:hypothetical protein